jgi:hypothetical protein
VSDFPTDETTLTLLMAACRINPDSGQTELHSFLDMGTRIKSTEDISYRFEGEGAPVFMVEYEPGYAPWSETQVIIALSEEILRLRAALNA